MKLGRIVLARGHRFCRLPGCLFVSLAPVLLTGSLACGQIVRFETSAGNFDVVLKPTNHARLQGHVDNFLQYVTSGRYDGTVINRADENFVLQMGLYRTDGSEIPDTVSGFLPIEAFAPVMGVPALEVGLSNTVGTVGLALTGGPQGTNLDSGTSSFFINLGNNSSLDDDFAVFARVPDMTTINNIMSLSQVDLTTDPDFGAGPVNLAFSDVPLLSNGDLVIVSRAFVVPEPSWSALLLAFFTFSAWRAPRPSHVAID
ncbi:MAG TPA: peptidylprolyl isomerase [Lacipirellulaceae bacterium]|nr:peptidylprolyl isomerase [Lacipirellulaceae bacterium]